MTGTTASVHAMTTLLEEIRMSQTDLAKILGIDPSTITAWKRDAKVPQYAIAFLESTKQVVELRAEVRALRAMVAGNREG